MSTIMNDLKLISGKVIGLFQIIKSFKKLFSRIKKTEEKMEKASNTQSLKKVSVFTKISRSLKPRAKLTYWIEKEKVTVFVNQFKEKDKNKIEYREINTGHVIIVNSKEPISYRLEQISIIDEID